MDDSDLEQLLLEHFKVFQKHDNPNATHIHEAIRMWKEHDRDKGLLAWWKEQDISYVAALQSYVSWLIKHKYMETQQFEAVYHELIPVISRSWSMPIELTRGEESPLFGGGFLDHTFTLFQYEFSPSGQGLLVTCEEFPLPTKSGPSLDTLLDFLSFCLAQVGVGYIGFRQLLSRRSTSSETAIIGTSLGPEITPLPDFNFQMVEDALSGVDFQYEEDELSLAGLLHIRHRAIRDSSLESKLINLWSSLEALWAGTDSEGLLLTETEREQVQKALKEIPNENLPKEKYVQILDQISKLKIRTKNERIALGISELQCAQGIQDVGRVVRDIFGLRGKLVHGKKIVSDVEAQKANQYVGLMMSILDELISRKLSENNITIHA